ncbi:MAG: ATP synthase subunit a [Bacteroidia bacterium]|nr:ATP synthase subunit a [Bacteroidia bacterium]
MRMKKSPILLLLLLVFMTIPALMNAQDSVVVNHSEAEVGLDKFDPGKMIIDHISDAHSWHLWGHTEIPLPVIVYSKDRGLSVFSSSHFEHGHKTYNGYMLNEANKIVAVNELEETDAHSATINEQITEGIYDISITKNVISLTVSIILLLLIFGSVAKAYKARPNQAPKGLQSWMEPLILFVRDDIAKSSIGPKYQKYMPYILTIFFFIWLNNLLGLIPVFPGGANLTGNIAITMSLAVMTLLVTVFSANKHYWHHVFAMPGVPVWVLIILTPIEILGVFLRPFVLMIRLFANIMAGHIIALSFVALIFIFGEMHAAVGAGIGVVSLLFMVFMAMLELLVGFLQAYVFALLSAIYIGAAVEEHDHDTHDYDAHVEEALIV